MNKKLLAVAVAAALAPAFAAAQTNVTMFGIVDTGLTWAKAGNNKVTGMHQDGIASNRFGVRGSEDLGGGLRANFHLESTIGPNGAAGTNGASGTAVDFSTRLGTVGLSGANWGSINMGRQYTPAFINIHTAYDLFGTNGVGAVSNITLGINAGAAAGGANNLASSSGVRASNSIKWDSPNWSGFTAAAMMNFGEQNNASSRGREIGFSLKYNPGNWSVALGYNKQDDNGLVVNNDVKSWMLGGHVNISAFKIVAGYQSLRESGGAGGVNARARDFWLGGQYAAGAHTVKLEYTRRNTNLAGNVGDANQWALGYIYAFSKRTDAYATYARIGNKSGSNYMVGTANLTQTAGAIGQRSSGLQFGVKHAF